MLVCEDCGEVYEEDNVTTSKSYLCTIDGTNYYENVSDGCSKCGGELVKADKCAICDSWKDKEVALSYSLNYQCYVCYDCLQEKSTPNVALTIGKNNPQNVSINGFLSHIFTPAQIEDILSNELIKKGDISVKARRFCNDDTYCLADYVMDECQQQSI